MEHFQPLVRRFFWVLLFSIVGITALGLGIMLVANRPPPALVALLPVVIASFDAGREFRRRTGEGPRGSAAWVLSVTFFAVNLGLSLFVLVGGLWSAGMLDMLKPSEIGILALPITIFAVVWFATIRVMLWISGSIR